MTSLKPIYIIWFPDEGLILKKVLLFNVDANKFPDVHMDQVSK